MGRLGKMYLPRGPALEHAKQVLQVKYPMALNVAWGCYNQCKGCFIRYTKPGVVRFPQKNPVHMFLGDTQKNNLPEGLFLCFETDPFLDCNKDVSRRIVDLAVRRGIRVATLSKMDVSGISGVLNGMTVVSVDEKYWQHFEPYARDPNKRVEILRKENKKGEETWVSMEPYRTPEKVKQDIYKFLENLCFVDFMIFGKQNYDAASNTTEARVFYKESVECFEDFCKSHGIRFWVKSGTQYFIKTGKILERSKKS